MQTREFPSCCGLKVITQLPGGWNAGDRNSSTIDEARATFVDDIIQRSARNLDNSVVVINSFQVLLGLPDKLAMAGYNRISPGIMGNEGILLFMYIKMREGSNKYPFEWPQTEREEILGNRGTIRKLIRWSQDIYEEEEDDENELMPVVPTLVDEINKLAKESQK